MTKISNSEENKEPMSDSFQSSMDSLSRKIEESENHAAPASKEPAKIHREGVLELSALSDMTVEEVVENAEEVELTNLATEDVLDKYIRMHRAEIEEGKKKLGQEIDDIVAAERAELPEQNSSEAQQSFYTKNAETAESSAAVETENKESAETEVLSESQSEPRSEAQVESPAATNESLVSAAPILDKSSNLQEISTRIDTIDNQEQTEPPAPLSEAVTENKENQFDEIKLAPATGEDILPPLPQKRATKPAAPAKPEPSQNTDTEKADAASEAADVSEANETKEAKESTSRIRTPIIIGVVMILAAAGTLTAYSLIKQNEAAHQPSASSSSSSSTSLSSAVSQFTKTYDSFFTDSSHTALKNASLDNLANLQKDLTSLKSDKDYSTYQTEVTNLSSDISSVKAVNLIFDKPVIVDGKLDTTAKIISSSVTIPTVKSKNSTIDALLQSAVKLAQDQVAAAKSSEASSSSSASSTPSSSAPSSSQPATDSSSDTSSNAPTSPANNGVQNPTGATPDNSNARVQPQANLNPSDPAFTWAPGVFNKVISTCQSRGYISGTDYILEPVAIHTTNGVGGAPAGIVSGYYNLYSPSGQYLVTINCKTGYWFGNSKGLPLDFTN